MIHVIMGLKGSGKTKKLIDAIHAAVAEAHGDVLSLYVNNEKVLETTDDRFAYGMAGFAHPAAGESIWNGFHITSKV